MTRKTVKKTPGSSKKLLPTPASKSKEPVVLDPEVENELDSSDPDGELDREAIEIGTTPAEIGAAEEEEDSDSLRAIEVHERAISPSDPLRRYIEEARRYPLLNPEEEKILVRRLQTENDLEAAKRLVQSNLRLVIKIAFEYKNLYSNVLDLIQEGNIGLMKAVSKFDPSKGARLGYYSSWWIRSYILKYLLDNFRLVKVGTTQAQKKLFYHLMREKERLESQGLLAGPKLLAERLDVREKDVIEMQQRLSSSGAEMSLDAPIDSDSDDSPSFAQQLPDHRELAEETLVREQLLEFLKDHLAEITPLLGPKERDILDSRLLAEEPATLQEVADRYGLTRERARQIEAKLISKLRDYFVRKNQLD
jgi:RNA polymerase sigma-32 factor